MPKIKGVFANKFRERPFDLYVACLIFIAGLYSVVNDRWPETYHDQSIAGLIFVISLYMMLAGVLVIISLLCNRQRRPIFAILAEMWGWFAISAAASATSFMYGYMQLIHGVHDLTIALILFFIWAGLALASAVRAFDIFLVLRGKAK